MIFKQQISLMLAAVMTFGTVNIAFADNNNVSDVSYVQKEESEIIPMSDKVTYSVEGGNIYFDKSTGAITGADESITSVNIPGRIGGVAVTSIGNFAFYNCSLLTSIDIPDSVTSIGKSAFYNCSSLTSIDIPDSVTFIGGWAFSTCSALTSITIPKGVTSIEEDTFTACYSLTSIAIPEGVTSIGRCAFDGCSSLTNITIPESVTSIGEYAFGDCDSLTSINIPKGVTFIGKGSFVFCDSLTNIIVSEENADYADRDGILFNKNYSEIISYPIGKTDEQYTIPDSVTSIWESAFNRCIFLTSIIIPDSVNSIGEYAFNGCNFLTSINIPDSVTFIGEFAFSRCDSLTSITIPDSVTSIGISVFYDCSSLTSITIPDSITSIGEWAFNGCNELKDVYYGGSEEQWKAINIGERNDYLLNATIHYNSVMPTTESTSVSTTESTTESTTVTESTTETTTSTTETTTESTTLTETTTESTTEPTTEPDYVLSGSSIVVPVDGGNIYIDKDRGEVVGCDEGVTSVVIPSKVNGIEVKSISADAFKNCKDLKSITIPDTVTAIAENAFADCVSLTEIHCTKGSFADNKALYPENTEIKYNEAVLYGDADGNGTLNAADAAMVLQKVLKGSFKMTIEETVTDYMPVVDVDRNNSLNAADAAMILQKVLKSSFKMTCET